MNDLPNLSDDDLRRLALRRFEPGELATFEERLLLEDGLAERLREAEHDLIDDYVAGRLSTDERVDVERHLVAAGDGAMAVRVARALAVHRAADAGAAMTAGQATPRASAMPVDSARQPARHRVGAYRWQPIAAALVAAIAVGVQLRTRQPAMPVPSPTVPAGDPAPPAAAAAPKPTREQTMSLSLDRTRGAAERTVRIAPDTDTVRLQVEIDEAADAGPYTLLLRADSAHEPYRAEGLVPRSAGPYRFVEAAIPRAAWAAGLVTVNVSAGHGQDGQGARAWTLRVVVDSGS